MNLLHVCILVPRTLQNWEQGRRYPTGPAATLIRILDAHPSLI